MVQHLVNHGYAVLGANNRGSSGYGKTFFHMDDKKHGEADLRDIVAGGDWLRAQDWVADDQVAVMGGSYGGYITAAALAFHPDKFEAGIDIFGVTNWVRTTIEYRTTSITSRKFKKRSRTVETKFQIHHQGAKSNWPQFHRRSIWPT